MQVRNSHVFVVGGSTGIGAALVRHLLEAGATVTALGLPGPELDAIGAETGAATIGADLADLGGLAGMIDRVEALNGPVDVLVCMAAICPSGPFQDYSADTLQRAMTINLISHMELVRQALPGMIDRGTGTIAVTSSLSTEVRMIHLGCYVTPKAGLATFAANLESEVRDYGVRVFNFTLGTVKGTPLAVSATQDPVVGFLEKRAGDAGTLTTEEVAARMVRTLASDRRGGTIAIPKVAQALVGYRALPSRLLEPVLGRPARKAKRESAAAAAPPR